MNQVIDFLGGAVACTYLIAAVFFLKFWRRTRDRLFLSFAGAFCLFALNGIAISGVDSEEPRRGFIYLLRVLGYLLILYAIVRKNTRARHSGQAAGGSGVKPAAAPRSQEPGA